MVRIRYNAKVREFESAKRVDVGEVQVSSVGTQQDGRSRDFDPVLINCSCAVLCLLSS